MNFVRKLFAPAACSIGLLLALGSSSGCKPKKPPGTNPPGEDGGASGRRGKRGSDGGDDGSTASADDGGDDGDGPRPSSCAAKTSDTPKELFGGLVLMRPPVGVSFAPPDNPSVEQAISSAGFVSACDASIKRMLVIVYQNDKKKGLDSYIDDTVQGLQKQGYTGGNKSAPMTSSKTDYHLSVEYPATGGNQATNLYIAAARRYDNVFIVLYEAEPEDFKLLEPTFKESAESLLVIPPDA